MGIFSKLIESLSDLMEISVVLPEKNVLFCPNCANKIDPNAHFCEVCGLNIHNLRVVPKIKNDNGDEISKLKTKNELKLLEHSKLPPSEQDVIDSFEIKMERGNIELKSIKSYLPYIDKIIGNDVSKAINTILGDPTGESISSIFRSSFGISIGEAISVTINDSTAEGAYLVYNNHIVGIHYSRSLLGQKRKKIPENIGNLSELLYLGIIGSDIEKIPQSIGKLKKLIYMRLYGNFKLSSLPESIGGLKQLRKLDLDYNNLTTLPESIGNLSNLFEIVLDHNQITILPQSFKKLNLYDIRTMETPLRSLSNINFSTIQDYLITIANLTPKGKNLLSPWDDNYRIYDSEDEDDHRRTIRNFVPVSAYYSKSPSQLAIQFCEAPNSLSDEEIERLIWEASPKERELLEANFPADNEIIQKINERLSIRLNSDSKIII